MSYTNSINQNPTTTVLNHGSYFDKTYIEPNNSPIDNYFDKTDDLNKLFIYYDSVKTTTPPPVAFPDKTLHNLILLGYVSAVESYFRELIRKTILVDTYSSKNCEKYSVKYGAAIIHSKEIMPEALLESSSFASKENIKNSLRDFLELKSIYNNSALDIAAGKFQEVCQLRHILIHRYGKLGVDNFIKLENQSLVDCIEKPLELNAIKLYEISVVCNNLILSFNEYIFQKVLERTAKNPNLIWEWNFHKDRQTFKKYYNVFICRRNPPPTGVPTPFSLYDNLRIYGDT